MDLVEQLSLSRVSRKSDIRVLFPLMPVSTTKKTLSLKTNKQASKQIANLDIIRA